MHEVAVKGLAAQFGDNKIQELAAELVRLAKEGLNARIEAGLEQPEVLNYLEPVEEAADSGETFAEVCLRRWQGEFQRSPALYVDAYRI
jgi:glutamate--cysteine ligase